MLTTASRAYGVADPAEVRQHVGARIPAGDPRRATAGAADRGTLSFWLTEIGDGFAVFEGDAGPHLLNPLGDRTRRLGADADRQRGRLRRPHAAAGRRELHDN